MADVTQEEAPASDAARWSWKRNPKCVRLAMAALSDRWHVDARMVNDHYAVGKTIWFEIDRSV
ncbi:hypothetical protein [Streptomyces acidiscabies]|uniref:hypothetical protein n=1 Tax=Streptomyces acidiscabies TaxID=42234 RepID=UPI00076EFF26|nr:hypothetical protein [Streptomyces acidiscabies]GAQ54649.1 hypothetical protein a10_04463 [Streptomyces acidiscabies]